MSANKKSAHPTQLSLDIDPANDPVGADAALATKSSPDKINAWSPQPEQAWSAPSSPWDALLLAAELNHTDLIDSLLALPFSWDLKASEPGTRSIRGLGPNDEGKTALHLLLRHRSNWNSETFESDRNQAQKQALELTRRGADFLRLSEDRQSALGIAAQHDRQLYLCGLKGHPDFVYEKIKDLRVGSHNMAVTAQDARPSILGHLIREGLLNAAKAMIEDAGWPVNAKDFLGKLPLGYSRHALMTETLLKLGADPALEDDNGLNAMAMAQNADNTQERDKMISLLALAFRKGGGKNDPQLMAQLQADNMTALLEAAENSPKSSLLKIISAFRFDIAQSRDAKTGLTPLMASLRGGRLSSAAHLMSLGASINDQDQQGRSAAAYLLLGWAASGSPSGSANTFYNSVKDQIDWTLQTPQGFPTAFQPFLLENPRDTSLLGIALSRVTEAGLQSHAPLKGPHGEPLMSVVAPALSRELSDWRGFEFIRKALAETLRIGQPEGVDWLLKSALIRTSRSGYSASGPKDFFNQVTRLIQNNTLDPQSVVVSTEFFNTLSAQAQAKLAEGAPNIHSFLELCSLRQDTGGLRSSAKKPGSRL